MIDVVQYSSPSYLSMPLCWQCNTSVDGRSPSIGRPPGGARESWNVSASN